MSSANPATAKPALFDKDFEASVVADHGVDEAGNRVKPSDTSRARIASFAATPAVEMAWSRRSRRSRPRMLATTRKSALASSIEVNNPKPPDAPVTRQSFQACEWCNPVSPQKKRKPAHQLVAKWS
jgi:hypothetical protein